jgi:cysteine-rich repeat protein
MKAQTISRRVGWVATFGIASSACGVVDEPAPVEQVGSVQAAIRVLPADLCEFTVYSDQRSDIRDRSRSSGGFVGSRTAVELGSAGLVTGHIRSGGSVLLRSTARVEGNVTAEGAITQQGGVVVTGTLSPNTPVTPFTIPTKAVTAGVTDVNVLAGQTRILAPGSYRDVHAFGGATLRLRSGVYNMRSLVLESGSVRVVLDITNGPIDINVQGQLRFGDRMNMQLVGGTNPRQVRYYTNWPNQVSIGTDLTLLGVLTAPNAEITAFSRVNVRGSLFGRRVTLDTDGSISGACECGNGTIDNATEQCDDGNTNDNDACTNDCKTAFCGDGIVRTGVEECDDGNTNDLDSCTTAGAFGAPGCEFRPLRKNVALISQAERTALISAMRELDNRIFAQDGVSFWDKQDQIHESTHIHGGPQFLPWHRELLNRFERELRKVDPSVALHYWDWTTDPTVADPVSGRVSLFGPNDPTLPPVTFGLAFGPSGEEVRAGYPFDIMDANGVPPFRPPFAESKQDFQLPVEFILRQVGCNGSGFSSDVDAITPGPGVTTQGGEWPDFSGRLNSEHGGAHGCMGGSIGPVHRAFEDPFVYILHSNVDRIWALWQTAPGKTYRLDPAQTYGDDATPGSITLEELSEELEPWNGNPTHSCPTYPPPEPSPNPCPMDPWDPADPNNEIQVKTCFDTSVVRPPRFDTNGSLP